MHVSVEHRLAATPDRIFAVLSDPARRPEWQENTQDVELLTAPPAGLGSRWRESQRGIGRVEVEVVGFAQGSLWAEAGSAEGGGGRLTVRLEPDGGEGTRVSVEVELQLRGARRFMGPALAPVVRRQIPRDLDRLATLLG